ncbi:MAG: DUF5309 family protein [Anaerolineae bacterium]
MPVRGTVNTASESATRVPIVHELQLLEKSAARFLRLLTKLRGSVREVNSPTFKIQERRPRGQSTRVNMVGGYVAIDTVITVDDASIFSKGDTVLFTRAQEMARVVDINYTANTIELSRGMGSTPAVLNDDDYLLRIARVEDEGYNVGASWVTSTTHVTQYAGTISTPVRWSNYMVKEWSYLSKSQRKSRKKADEDAMAIEHLREIDRALLYSRKAAIASTGGTLYSSAGLIPSITTNVYDHAGGTAITETQYNTNCIEPAWAYGPSTKKYQLSSSKALSELGRFQRDNVYYEPGVEQTMGFEVSKYRTIRGEISIVHCPHLDVPYYDESLVIADFNFLRLALFEDTKYNESIQNPESKTILNEWSTICGLDLEYEECHVFARDLRTAA